MYDPWEDYSREWATNKKPVPPYRSLLELVGHLEADKSSYPFHLTPESIERLTAWCSEYGLLGILPLFQRHSHARPYRYRGGGVVQAEEGMVVAGCAWPEAIYRLDTQQRTPARQSEEEYLSAVNKP